MFYIVLGALALYVLYRVLGRWVLPAVTRRRMERYKKDFFSRNPHIDADRYEERQREAEEKSPIIDRRRRLR